MSASLVESFQPKQLLSWHRFSQIAPLILFLAVSNYVIVELLIWTKLPFSDWFIEDGPIELTSALLFAAGFLISLISLFVVKTKNEFWQIMVVAGFAAFCFLEEFSYGERYFQLTMPRIGNFKIDTVHDFVPLTHRVLTHAGLSNGQLFVILISVAALGLVIFRRQVIQLCRWAMGLTNVMRLRLVVAAALFGLTASVLDIKVGSTFMRCTEEMLELNAGLLVVFAACLSFFLRNGSAGNGTTQEPA